MLESETGKEMILCGTSFAMRLIVIFVVAFTAAGAGYSQDRVPLFTDEDLEQFQRSSDVIEPVEGMEPGRGDTGGREPPPPFIGTDEGDGLSRYEVPYRAYEGTARRIIIPVTFNGSVTAPMALDTGAPGMFISPAVAGRLGIYDSDMGKLSVQIGGVGGRQPAILTIIDTVEVGGAEDHFVPTTITPSISSEFEGLIGMDFMANFTIKIDTRKRVVVFEEMPPRPDEPAGHDEFWWRTTFHRFASMRAEWRAFRDSLHRAGDSEDLEMLMRIADNQYQEADKLFNRLNGYAIEHAVPMNWRQY